MRVAKIHKSIRIYEWSTIQGTLCKIQNKVFSFETAFKDKDVTCKRCLAKMNQAKGDV